MSKNLASFDHENVHRLNGKAKYFTIETNLDNLIIDNHKFVSSKADETNFNHSPFLLETTNGVLMNGASPVIIPTQKAGTTPVAPAEKPQ